MVVVMVVMVVEGETFNTPNTSRYLSTRYGVSAVPVMAFMAFMDYRAYP